MVKSGVTEGEKNSASFIFHEWTQQPNMKPQAKTQRFTKLFHKRNSS